MLCLPVGLNAQEKPEPPRRSAVVPAAEPDTVSQDSAPTITLPEFEITGEENINLGVDSKAAVDDSWNLRSSTIEGNSGEKGDLVPLGTSEMAGLPVGRTGLTGQTIVSMGSFQTPAMNLWLGVTSPSTSLLLRSSYTSSAGHVDHSDYRDGSASISGTSHVGRRTFLPGNATIGGKFGFSGAAYRLYGSSTPDLQRTINRVQGVASVDAMLTNFNYEAGLFFNGTSATGLSGSSESEIGLRGSASKEIKKLKMKGTLDLWTDQYSSPTTTQNPYLAGLLLDVRYDLTRRFQVNGGMGLYSLQGSVDNAEVRFFPVAGVVWKTTDRINLSARYAPFIERSSLSWLLQQNPYLDSDVQVKHPDYHTNLEVAADVEASAKVSGRVAFKYQRADNVPIFAEQTEGVPPNVIPAGMWGIDYSGTTRIFGLDAKVSTNLTSASFALFSFAWRSAKNSTTDRSIAYSPEVQATAVYRHTFAFGVILQTDLNVYGPQFADSNEGSVLQGYALWDVKGEYEVLPLFVVGLGVQNILDQSYERWRGYVGIPRTAMLFGRYSW